MRGNSRHPSDSQGERNEGGGNQQSSQSALVFGEDEDSNGVLKEAVGSKRESVQSSVRDNRHKNEAGELEEIGAESQEAVWSEKSVGNCGRFERSHL